MDIFTTSVVLLAASFHAVWNAIVKSDQNPLFSLTSIMLMGAVIALFLSPFVGLPAVASWPYLAASVLIHTLYYISLTFAYRHGDFAQVYPIARGLAPIVVTFWGVWVIGEKLTPVEFVAVFGVITGITIFAFRRGKLFSSDKQAIGYALLTALFISAYTLIDGVGGRLSGNVHGYMVWLSMIDGLPLFLFALARQGSSVINAIKTTWKLSLLGGALSLAAYWLVVWAMTQAPIPLVAALRETSIIIAALIGVFFFKEKMGHRRIFAACLVCGCIVLLRLY